MSELEALKIPIEVEARLKNIEKEIDKLVDTASKDIQKRYVELPLSVTTKIDADRVKKSELRTIQDTQKALIDHWNKMGDKGFSPSAEFLNQLVEKYQDFKKAVGKKTTVKDTEQFKELTNVIGGFVQSYTKDLNKFTNQLSKIQKQYPQFFGSTAKTKVRSTRSRAGSGAHISNEEIAANIKAEERRKLKGLKSITNSMRIRTPNYDNATKRDLQISNTNGEYRSQFMEMNARDKRIADKENRRDTYKEYRLTNSEQLQNLIKRSKVNTKYSQDKLESKIILDKLSEVQDKLIKGDSKVNPDDMIKVASAAINQLIKVSPLEDREAAKDNAVVTVVGKMLNKYHSMFGRLGITDGTPKGSGPNAEEAKQTMDQIILGIESMYPHTYKIYKHVDELAELTENMYKSGTLLEEKLSALAEDEFTKTLVTAIKNTLAPIANIGTPDAKQINKTAEKILTQNKVEGASERVADSKEIKGTRKVIDTTRNDASTGMNTDANARSLIQETANVGEQIKSKFDSFSQSTQTLNTISSESQGSTRLLEAILTVLSSINGKLLNFEQNGIKRKGKQTKKENEEDANISVDNKKEGEYRRRSNFDLDRENVIDLAPNRDKYKNWKDSVAKSKNTSKPNPSVGIWPDAMYMAGPASTLIKSLGTALRPLVEYDPKYKTVKTQGSEISGLPSTYVWDGKKLVDNSNNVVSYDKAHTFAPGEREFLRKYTGREVGMEEAKRKRMSHEVEAERERFILARAADREFTNKVNLEGGKLEKEEVKKSILGGLKTAFASSEAERILNMTKEQQKKLSAERARTFGLIYSDRPTATGTNADVNYKKAKYGWGKKVSDSNLYKDLRVTPGINMDTTRVMDSLNKTLSGIAMFDAQTGGGTFRNLIGSMTGYIGMPSLEKSRAQIDGVNQVMANIRTTMEQVLQSIETKQTTLQGLKEKGDLLFNSDGTINEEFSTSEAVKLFADLEEQKIVLQSILTDVAMVDSLTESTRGNVAALVKQLGFTSPVLRENNLILKNINAGLDKNGKALKFQTRTAETLNYSFQLMARSIGQMWKNWMVQLNPLTQIKKLFADFMSYDTKWQRTMNVIKYNLRRIFKPMMEWIAQQLVNIIGLFNALLKGMGRAFGKDWDLFDKTAASAEKTREEMEQAANVSAGFDELHDISGDTGSGDAAMDLSGDIYTPQWEGLNKILESIGETIGKIIKAVSDWTFWDWLKLIGAALVGYIALKWLIGLFSKKNPLEAVAKGFSFLEKAVGWAILIWAFTSFTKALTEFVECMKTASLEDVAKVLITLAGAFAALAGAAGLLMWFSSVLAMSAPALLGVAAIAAAFALFTSALTDFVECMKTADLETIGKSLFTLAGAFATLGAASGMMMAFASMLGMNGPALLGLGAIAGAFALFTEALVPFIETMKGVTDVGTIIGSIVELVGAFTALAIGMGLASKLFHAMDWSSIGQLAVIAGIFDLFMLSLIPFINGIKDIPWETLAAGAVLIAGAFISLGGAIALAAPAIKLLDWTSVLQLAVVMAAFAGVIWVLKEFVLALQTLSEGQIATGLQSLGATLLIVAGAIGVLAGIFTLLVATGVGALAIGLLAGVLAVSALVIVALADLVTALGESGEGIKLVLEGVATVIESIGTQITGIFQTIADGVIGTVTAIGEAIATVITSIGDAIATVIGSVASGIESVLTSISDFVDNVLDKIIDLAVTVSHEVGETIRSVVETVGDVIVRIIESVVTAIQNLMTSILNFIRDLGPAIDSFVTSLCNTITRMVNFIVSAFEYVLNVGVSVINGLISAANKVPGVNISYASKVSIARFVPKYEKGTNYVPNDGLAYLHEGEAVIPKKYNTPYNPVMSAEEKAYMQQMISTMKSLDGTMKRGISVNGQFVQRGSDLVAVVNKTKSQTGADLLSNVSYAR